VSGRNNETWVYDVSETTWTQRFPATSPSARNSLAMAYIGGDQVLLFGGRYDITGYENDTWVYDLSANTWTQLFPVTSPSARYAHAMASLGGNQVLMFGGYTGSYSGQTWVYDLSETTWTHVFPTSSPSARFLHDMAPLDGRQVILFGGQTGTLYGDTWLFRAGGDQNPPAAIDDLTIALEGGSKSSSGNMFLSWTEPPDDIGVERYVIYRSTDLSSLGDSLAGTTDTNYTDTGAVGNTGTNYFYVAKAVDAAGNKSAESNRVGEHDLALTNGTKAIGERERRRLK
jgi:N-acetylneuraminic acid mutarotase